MDANNLKLLFGMIVEVVDKNHIRDFCALRGFIRVWVKESYVNVQESGLFQN